MFSEHRDDQRSGLVNALTPGPFSRRERVQL
jgi:hypothetical protein